MVGMFYLSMCLIPAKIDAFTVKLVVNSQEEKFAVEGEPKTAPTVFERAVEIFL